MDETDPLLQVARRHAKLHFPGRIAQSHAPIAELVVNRQLPDAPGIHEGYPREVDERWPSRSQTVAQRVIQDLLVSDVDLPGELDQYGVILAPVALCRLEYR